MVCLPDGDLPGMIAEFSACGAYAHLSFEGAMTNNARQSSILSSFIMCAVLAAVLAALPAASASAQVGQFDGLWRVEHTSASCRHKSGSFTLRIAGGTVRGRRIAGTISSSGDVRWSSSAAHDAAPVVWEGRFRGATGLGTYERSDGKCRGSFRARRG
jgi:hypothetical protein